MVKEKKCKCSKLSLRLSLSPIDSVLFFALALARVHFFFHPLTTLLLFYGMFNLPFERKYDLFHFSMCNFCAIYRLR